MTHFLTKTSISQRNFFISLS